MLKKVAHALFSYETGKTCPVDEFGWFPHFPAMRIVAKYWYFPRSKPQRSDEAMVAATRNKSAFGSFIRAVQHLL
jgi:hypothetical protein